jgi:hypothetical protein
MIAGGPSPSASLYWPVLRASVVDRQLRERHAVIFPVTDIRGAATSNRMLLFPQDKNDFEIRPIDE